MSKFEVLRGKPAILDYTTGRIIRLNYRLQEEPAELSMRVAQKSSLGGLMEARADRSGSLWRLIQKKLSREEADQLRALEQNTLELGEKIEIIRDDEMLFHLAGDSEEEQWSRMQPSSDYKSYTPSPWSGVYSLGSLGVWPEDSLAGASGIPTTLGHGVPLNGDFVDGDLGALPDDWTCPGSSALAVKKSIVSRAGGIDSYCCKITSKTGAAATALRQDIELEDAIKDSERYSISILASSLRSLSTSVTGLLQVWVGPEDGSHSMVKAGECTPTANPTWFYFSYNLALFNLANANNLRVEVRVSSDIANGPVLLHIFHGENKKWWTGITPKSSSRYGLDGTRATAQALIYENRLATIHFPSARRRAARIGFTVALFFSPGWAPADIPYSTVTLYQDAESAYSYRPGLKIYADDAVVYAVAYLDSGSTILAQQEVTWVANDWYFIVASFIESSNVGTTSDGRIRLAVDDSGWSAGGTHNRRAGSQGSTIIIGSNPSGAASKNTSTGRFHNVTQYGFYIDETTPGRTLADIYNASAPPSRLRISTPAIISAQQRGSIVKFDQYNYYLDATFQETLRDE